MALSDWLEFSDSADETLCKRGVTTGIYPKPNGEGVGSFQFAFNSIAAVNRTSSYFVQETNFNPLTPALGASISGVIQRGLSTGATGFSPFLFVNLGGYGNPNDNQSVDAVAYMLGLSDENPSYIILRKGKLSEGVTSHDAGNGVLSWSGSYFSSPQYEPIAQATWVHIRLDVVVNLNSDNIIKCYQNNGPIATPIWVELPMGFTDDISGINSENKAVQSGFTSPLQGGRCGFGFHFEASQRRGFFDHIQVVRQKDAP